MMLAITKPYCSITAIIALIIDSLNASIYTISVATSIAREAYIPMKWNAPEDAKDNNIPTKITLIIPVSPPTSFIAKYKGRADITCRNNRINMLFAINAISSIFF